MRLFQKAVLQSKMEIFTIFLFSLLFANAFTMSDLYRLERYLFDEYTKIHRPVKNSSKAVKVSYDMALEQLIEVDVKNEMAKWLLWERAEWEDEYLTWDPKNFSGVNEIRLHPRQIWLPDLVVFNSVFNFERNTDTSIPIYVNHKGLVRFYSPEVRTTFCPIDVKFFPYDTQKCSIVVGSWTYLKEMLDIVNNRKTIDLSYFIRNGEWDLYDTGARIVTLTYPEGSFQELHFSIIISRKPLYYEFNLILPAGMIAGIAMLDFLLPCESGEKISLAITVLLSLCVNMLFVSNLMPATSLNIPILGKYFIMTIAMVAMSLVLTVGVLNLHHPNSNVSVLPKWVKVLFFDFLAPLLLLGKYKEYLDEDQVDGGGDSRKNKPNLQDQFQSEALEKKIFQESNFWNGNANASRQGSTRNKKVKKQPGENHGNTAKKPPKLTKQQAKTFNKQKDKFKLNNPFQKRRSTLQSIMYQGMFTAHSSVGVDNEIASMRDSQPDIGMEESRLSGIGGSSNSEESIAIRLDRIEDILLYLACRLRNQEILENIKQEWRFLAEVIDRVLVIAFMLTTFICTYMLISNAKSGGHQMAIKMAEELKRSLNSSLNSTEPEY